MPPSKAHLRSAAIIVAVILLDRLTKIYIRNAFSFFDTVPVIPGFFNIVHTENPGAAFGMLAGAPEAWRILALVGISLIVMGMVALLLWKPRLMGMQETTLLSVALALVLGGACGNMWDRVVRGTVTDFLQFFFGSYEFPSFNVADSAITVGASLLILELWLHRNDPRPA